MELKIEKVIESTFHFGANHTFAAYLICVGSAEIIAKVFGEGKQQCRERAEDFVAKVNRRVSI